MQMGSQLKASSRAYICLNRRRDITEPSKGTDSLCAISFNNILDDNVRIFVNNIMALFALQEVTGLKHPKPELHRISLMVSGTD